MYISRFTSGGLDAKIPSGMTRNRSSATPWYRVLSSILLLFFFVASSRAFSLPSDCRQLILGVADDWNSSSFTVQCFSRDSKGPWQPVIGPIPVRGGKAGLVWGRGIHPLPANAAIKHEGDWKTPCGVFTIGGAYGYAPRINKHADLPYHQIVPGDLWVEDASSPDYNHFIALGRPVSTDWERKQQMRFNDPAHSLKLFIAHNAAPDIQAGAGSSIFFHIWRDNGGRPTAGCTVMARDNLARMIAWVDPASKPLYVLLPKTVYDQVKKEWQLPEYPAIGAKP